MARYQTKGPASKGLPLPDEIRLETARIASGFLRGDERTADFAVKFADPKFTRARRYVFGFRNIRWHQLGTPPENRQRARFSRVKPTPVDANSFQGKEDIEAWLKCFVAMSEMEEGTPDPVHCWRGRHSDLNKDEFIDGMVSRLGTDISNLADDLLSLLQSGDPAERALVYAVAGLNFTGAASLAQSLNRSTKSQQAGHTGNRGHVIDHPLLLMRLVMLASSFRVQSAARFLQAWNHAMSKGVFARLSRLLFRLPQTESLIKSGSFARGFRGLSRQVSRLLRVARQNGHTGRGGGARSGRWPAFVWKRLQREERRGSALEERKRALTEELASEVNFDAARRQQVTAELDHGMQVRERIDQRKAKADDVLQPLGDKIFDVLPFMMDRLTKVYELRHIALEVTLGEVRSAAGAGHTEEGSERPRIDFAGTSSFRAVSCGLTPRAFLMALAVEYMEFARHFTQCPGNWQKLAAQMDYRLFAGHRFSPGQLAQVAPFINWSRRQDWDAALAIVKPLAVDLDLGNFDHGGLDEDIRIGMRFLEYVYLEVDWAAGFPDPLVDAASFRKCKWMSLYVRFCILGHLLPAPPRDL